jgi:hypothetical protein
MASKLRTALSVAALAVLVVGVALFYLPAARTSLVVVSQERQLCTQPISAVIIPLHAAAFTCPVVGGGWVTAAVTSVQPALYAVTLTDQSTGSQPAVYRQSGLKFTMDFPTSSNGTITLEVSNPGPNSTTISGSYKSAVEIHVQDSMTQSTFPYRTRGAAVAGVGGVLSFLLIWDPGKIATRTLGRLRRAPPNG